MTLIDGDRIITAQLYDDEYEEFTEKKMSIIDFVNAYADERVTTADDVLNKIRAEILKISSYEGFELGGVKDGYSIAMVNVLKIIDKYKAEREPQESEDNKYNREKCYECCNKNKSVLDMPCVKCSSENDYIYFNARDWEYESLSESEE